MIFAETTSRRLFSIENQRSVYRFKNQQPFLSWPWSVQQCLKRSLKNVEQQSLKKISLCYSATVLEILYIVLSLSLSPLYYDQYLVNEFPDEGIVSPEKKKSAFVCLPQSQNNCIDL
jgi:hypothetical protein